MHEKRQGKLGGQSIKLLIRDFGASNSPLLSVFLLIDLRYFLRLKHVAAISITLWAPALPITLIFSIHNDKPDYRRLALLYFGVIASSGNLVYLTACDELGGSGHHMQ